MMKKGRFVVVDGLDGIGKDHGILSPLTEEARKEGLKVFDLKTEFWNEQDYHPDPKTIIGNYDVILTSEPTYVGIGRYIRQEIIRNNGRDYSPEIQAEAYALDRRILYEQLLLPLLEARIDVYQSRSFSTSLVYQRQVALDLGREFNAQAILQIPGNAFCLKRPMDFLIIPTINDTTKAWQRLRSREKQDDSVLEQFEFQLCLKPHYESAELRQLFESLGTIVRYIDASGTEEETKEQARRFYQEFLSQKQQE